MEPEMLENTAGCADWRSRAEVSTSAFGGVKTGGYDFGPCNPLKGGDLELLLSELP